MQISEELEGESGAPDIGNRAPDCPVKQLVDGREQEIALATLWQKGPAVLVFLRHFG